MEIDPFVFSYQLSVLELPSHPVERIEACSGERSSRWKVGRDFHLKFSQTFKVFHLNVSRDEIYALGNSS